MKKILTSIAVTLLTLGAFAQDRPTHAKPISEYKTPEMDFSVLENMAHPRLLVTPAQMDLIRDAVKNPKNPDYPILYKALIKQADKYVKENKILIYKKDVSGRRILSISRDALARIFACAYAYVSTGNEKYVKCAEFTMNTVCDFPNWNPSHYLDTAEMGMAVAIGYDWLFDVLSPETKAKAADKLYKYVIFTALDKTNKYSSTRHTVTNNWNQVCNAGCVAASLAVYEQHPEEAKTIISRSVPWNMRAAEYMYAPDGVYPEGAGYWSYGTNFQIFLNTLLTRAFGTDFGLSDVPGFSKTGRFFMYSQSNIGKKFDYSDTGDGGSTFNEAWYFAERFNDPSCLYLIHKAAQNGKVSAKAREFPLFLIYAARYVAPEIPAPADKVYYGGGNIPIVIARTGWDKEDAYLGIKGGYGGYNHGHLDVGSFVFEEGGIRWASELHAVGGYSPIEKAMKDNKMKGGLFNSKPDSHRWTFFSYSNRDHSTLTVNDKIHDPYASCDFSQVIDEPSRIGGTMDITKLFGGDVESAVRTVVIKDKRILEITDVIKAPADRAAQIRFTLVSDTQAEAGKKNVILSTEEASKKLTATGAKVKYQTWSTNPADYPNPVNDRMKAPKGKSISGYTYTVPAGKTVTVVTTLK